ncbi:MAG: bifunctional folylpolyglutamate synthase/dihydrofolate synthase [Alphaproteobacteria bacterium]|nr:bifunctional folylpolyglutamate synthase/dihydrofolate synthase [Alphaproteobacteria bacterium]
MGVEFDHGHALDLSRIEAALAALGHPERRLPPVLHVAGTNGKGSTCAFARAIAEAAGLRAHVFTSPHLVRPNERVRLAGTLASDAALIDALDRIAATGRAVTYFEAITAAAFLLFAETPADVTILEVGLGGRLDATNVATPAACVITPVDYDHMAILGDTIGKIAGEKAGILKPGVPAVIARQHADAAAVIEARAEAVGAPLLRAGVDWDAWSEHRRLAVQTLDRLLDLPPPSLPGPHQIENAAVAVVAMQTLDARLGGALGLDDDACARGVASAVWPARMQRLQRGPLAAQARARGIELWLDGGHNPHGARAIAQALARFQAQAPRPTWIILGVLDRKDLEGVVAPLAQAAAGIVAIPVPQSAASRDPRETAAAAARFGVTATTAEDVTAALAQTPDGARVLICGSLYLAGAVLADNDPPT